MKEKGFNLITVILIMLITAVVSGFTTGVILNNNYKGQSGLTYTEVMNDAELNEFLSVYSQIVSEFYNEVDTTGMVSSALDAIKDYEGQDKKEMLDIATTAMLEFLGDDYTTFLSSEESDDLLNRLEGTYKGIGIIIQGNTINNVTMDTPAYKAGLEANDIIVNIDGIEITEDNIYSVATLIQNSESDTVKITVLRNENRIEYSVQKETLNSSIMYSMVDESNIGYIDIDVFSDNVGEGFSAALETLESLGAKSLIIDLRYNTGGYLDGAVDISELFLKKGETIYSLENQDGKIVTKDETNESKSMDVIILINKDSASASEILAAALKDSYGALIVGEDSYGKGKVQQTIETSNGSLAKYTSAKWYTPEGICIDGVGIFPDIYIEREVILNEEGEIIQIIDSQLNKAIEILKEAK